MNINKIRLIAAALVLGSLGSLTACGGGGRPSVDELSDSLKSASGSTALPDKVADCMAKAYHDSELSDGALKAIVDQDKDYKPSDKDTKALSSVTENVAKDCVSDEVEKLKESLEDLPSDLPSELPSELASLVPSDLPTQ